jgi:cytochrome c oxidase subunit 3
MSKRRPIRLYEVTFDSNILLVLVFTGFQRMEYIEAPFTISDGIYGSTIFLATGFHGFHVIIGTIF